MNRKNRTSHQVPSIHDLLSTKISQDNINIEDGLSSPDDENIFLLASMAFLKQQLRRKLELNSETHLHPREKFSDMLLFERKNDKTSGHFYIQLKNSEKFDEIKKSEINIPETVLSSEQILPKVKKSKMLKLTNLFRTKSKGNVKKTKKTTSILSVFRKSNEIHPVPLEVKASSSSSDINKENLKETDWSQRIKNKIIHQNTSNEYLLRIIPNMENSMLKKSLKENFRISRKQEENQYESDSEYTNSVQSLPLKPKPLSSYNRRSKHLQSKLSVCIEDESESETEYSLTYSGISYNNFPDELKANLPPEILQNIISEMISFLEETPAKQDS